MEKMEEVREKKKKLAHKKRKIQIHLNSPSPLEVRTTKCVEVAFQVFVVFIHSKVKVYL